MGGKGTHSLFQDFVRVIVRWAERFMDCILPLEYTGRQPSGCVGAMCNLARGFVGGGR